jgi:hypothetical protein
METYTPASWVAGLRCGQRSVGAARRIGGQQHRPFEERGGRGQPAAGPRPPGGAFQLGGDLLVRPGRGLGPVPSPPVRVGLGDGGIGQGTMRAAPVGRGCRAIDGGPGERVRELDTPAQLE